MTRLPKKLFLAFFSLFGLIREQPSRLKLRNTETQFESLSAVLIAELQDMKALTTLSQHLKQYFRTHHPSVQSDPLTAAQQPIGSLERRVDNRFTAKPLPA